MIISPSPLKIKTPLQRRLLWTLLPVVLFPLVIAGLIASAVTYRRSLSQTQQTLNTQTLLVADLAHKVLQSRLSLLQFTAQSPLVIEALQAGTGQAEVEGLTELSIIDLETRFQSTKLLTPQPSLNAYLQRTAVQGEFAEVFITERHGLNVAYTHPTSDFVQRDEQWWQEGRHLGQWIGAPSWDESTQTITVDLVQSIQSPETNQFLGVIKGGYSATHLQGLAQDLEHDIQLIASEHLQLVVMGNRPTVIATMTRGEGTHHPNPNTQEILGGEAVIEQIQYFFTSPRNNEQTQSLDQASRINHFIIEDRLYTVARIEGTEWAVITSIDLATVRVIGYNLVQIFVGMSIGLGAIATVIAVLLSRSITHPIQQLTESAQQSVLEANFTIQVPVTTQDEVGALAETFNKLIHYVYSLLEDQATTNQQLEEYGQILALKVDERTQELRAKNDELASLLKTLKDTQGQMLHSEKMSALGQMVAGVAHEINNPVTFIHGNLSHVEDYTQDLMMLLHAYQHHYPDPPLVLKEQIASIDPTFISSDLTKILGSMATGTSRIQDIVLSLRSFSRLSESDFKEADIHKGLDSTLMLLQHRLKATATQPAIQLFKHYGSLPHIHCYPGQLNQVFMNILGNAIDAIGDGWTTAGCPVQGIQGNWGMQERGGKYQAHEHGIHEHIIEITTELVASNMVRVVISNNGPRIPEAIRPKIFEPFFTTKQVGDGTGLGLSICYQIVTERHKGKLQCQSNSHRTIFTIELPIYP